MGTKICAPRLEDLFHDSYHSEFLDKFILNWQEKLARLFNLSYGYTDQLMVFNHKRFKDNITHIYPRELTVEDQKLRFLILTCFSQRRKMTSVQQNFRTSVASLVSILLTFYFCLRIFYLAHHMVSTFHNS